MSTRLEARYAELDALADALPELPVIWASNIYQAPYGNQVTAGDEETREIFAAHARYWRAVFEGKASKTTHRVRLDIMADNSLSEMKIGSVLVPLCLTCERLIAECGC